MYKILHEYKIHNCEVLFREDATTDDFIDVIEGNRKYVKCLYVYNKIDMVSIEDVDRLARLPNSVVIACAHEDFPAVCCPNSPTGCNKGRTLTMLLCS